jgi:hypothetical protein
MSCVLLPPYLTYFTLSCSCQRTSPSSVFLHFTITRTASPWPRRRDRPNSGRQLLRVLGFEPFKRLLLLVFHHAAFFEVGYLQEIVVSFVRQELPMLLHIVNTQLPSYTCAPILWNDHVPLGSSRPETSGTLKPTGTFGTVCSSTCSTCGS